MPGSYLAVEGSGTQSLWTFSSDGTFQASSIMAKHSEEYRAPEGAAPGHEELLRTLRPAGVSGGASSAPR